MQIVSAHHNRSMNTKILMTASSVILASTGAFALFAPNEILAVLGSPLTSSLTITVQLLGALYLSFAFTNWLAKDSTIGGIYARPTSLGNFTHFTIGALVLARYQLSGAASGAIIIAMIVYAFFAVVFGWLVFVYGGTVSKKGTQG